MNITVEQHEEALSYLLSQRGHFDYEKSARMHMINMRRKSGGIPRTLWQDILYCEAQRYYAYIIEYGVMLKNQDLTAVEERQMQEKSSKLLGTMEDCQPPWDYDAAKRLIALLNA